MFSQFNIDFVSNFRATYSAFPTTKAIWIECVTNHPDRHQRAVVVSTQSCWCISAIGLQWRTFCYFHDHHTTCTYFASSIRPTSPGVGSRVAFLHLNHVALQPRHVYLCSLHADVEWQIELMLDCSLRAEVEWQILHMLDCSFRVDVKWQIQHWLDWANVHRN